MTESLPGLRVVLGADVAESTAAVWGFTNRTSLLTLTDGRRVVVQVYADRAAAAHRLHATEQLAEPLLRAGLPTPRLLHAALDSDPPYALFGALPGEPVNVVANHDLSAPVFVDIARAMGRMLPHLAAIPTQYLDLPRTWARPESLAVAAASWLDATRPVLGQGDVVVLRRVIDALPARFTGRQPVVAHGDFNPTNVLVAPDGRVTGLLDLEHARIADPLFDVAWWCWIVRFHTPEAHTRGWPAFLAAAGLERDDDLDDRVRALVALRLLEMTVAAPDTALRTMWAGRLARTLTWEQAPTG